MSLDAWVVVGLNSIIGHSRWVDLFWIFITSYFGYLLMISVVVYWILQKSENQNAYRNLLFIFCVIVLSSLIFTEGIHYFWYRLRPFLALPNVYVPFVQTGSSSFPSGHTATYFALAFGMYEFNKRIGGLYFVGASFVALSRVVLGVHYPSDIVGGVVVAWVSILIVKHAMKYRIE